MLDRHAAVCPSFPLCQAEEERRSRLVQEAKAAAFEKQLVDAIEKIARMAEEVEGQRQSNIALRQQMEVTMIACVDFPAERVVVPHT